MARLIIFGFFLMVLIACQPGGQSDKQVDYSVVSGETMGTYFNLTYADSLGRDFSSNLQALLDEINLQVSTYVPESTISKFNKANEQLVLMGGSSQEEKNKVMHFISNYNLSKIVYEATGGDFDPTVMPLVNYWGFGYTEKRKVETVDSLAIQSLMGYVGFDKVGLLNEGDFVLKKDLPGVQLDFSACAKGYAVDAIGLFLKSKGIFDFLVDIGGEQLGMGASSRGGPWEIGISTPSEGAALDDLQAIIPLENKAIATSGNYRNFYEVDGQKYSHTINPHTGFPERSNLLSATVLMSSCAIADAYATAFMVMGLDKAYQFALSHDGIEAYLIYSREDGSFDYKMTPGIPPRQYLN